jgi:hypothetical protein
METAPLIIRDAVQLFCHRAGRLTDAAREAVG